MDRHLSLRPLGGRGHCTLARVLRVLGWLAVLCGTALGLWVLWWTAAGAGDAGWLLPSTALILCVLMAVAAALMLGFAALLDALHKGAARTYLLDWEETEA